MEEERLSYVETYVVDRDAVCNQSAHQKLSWRTGGYGSAESSLFSRWENVYQYIAKATEQAD
jgi:hypothetical protein